jgi:phosphatidylinositol kinase/protein kinase (PI-3  family)
MWLKPYEILATGPNCGLIEYLDDTMSLDEIHRTHPTLLDYFYSRHGPRKSSSFKRA